ncbi:DoxX family membrane protein [Leifsonia sp. 2MCAF36]|uniref:DoxX family membrane protein n=1 Tax=Leifsonia sp. 2MCAF36 TaxID=3232988 RepID=UPI003F96C953
MSARDLAVPVLTGAARVVLGALWLNEGLLKYRAGFSGADIRLVTESAASNSRVPEYFHWFDALTLRPFPDLFGVAMPLLETALGVLLVLGVLTRVAALMSVATLLLYWSADQLITEYPIMLALSVIVVAWARPAAVFGVTGLLRRMRDKKPAASPESVEQRMRQALSEK